MSIFRFQSYDSYRTAISLFQLCAGIGDRQERERPVRAEALRRSTVALPLLIARSSVPGPQEERMVEVRGAVKAASRIRALLEEVAREGPRDAAVIAALELAERSAELLLVETNTRV